MWKFEHEIEVRFRDCDPLGHVNNAVYLTYLEAARFSWWRRAFGPSGLTEHGFIVARVEIDYRKPALPGERLLIRLRVESWGGRASRWRTRFSTRRTRELVAEAKSVQVAYHYAEGRSVPLSDDFRAKLEAAF